MGVGLNSIVLILDRKVAEVTSEQDGATSGAYPAIGIYDRCKARKV